MRKTISITLGAFIALGPSAAAQTPVGTAFAYQGRLTDGGGPAEGAFDFQLAVFDAASGGAQTGPTLVRDDIAVTGGLFTTTLDFGPIFTGAKRWLALGVRPGASTGAFTPLAPRQELTPTPGALWAATVPWTGIAGKPAGFADDVDDDALRALSCAPGEVAKWNGTAWACAPDDAGASAWRLAGNAGTSPATSFLGTTDAQPLEVRVNNRRVLRLDLANNLIGGFSGNAVTPGVIGAVIAGGGGITDENTVVDEWGTISGGGRNRAGDPAGTTFDHSFATVGGGYMNTAGNLAATVGGGENNRATGVRSSVSGGNSNLASGELSHIGGGQANTSAGRMSVVPGGWINRSGGDFSLAAGWRAVVRDAVQTGDADGDEGVFVWSDVSPAAPAFQSTGPNQFLVRATGGVGINTSAPFGDLQVGRHLDASAFRLGGAATRHHLLSNREMVFNAFDTDLSPGNGSSLFVWRRNPSAFDESSGVTLMSLSDTGGLNVVGTLTKGGGSFKIDHPLDPENRYLYHSFVESPDMKNVYDGVVATDDEGFATVVLPDWFEALNRDFRYQLTVMGDGEWARARVYRKVEGNRFVVQTDRPGVEVSWQVTGIRRDPWAEANRIPLEQDKPAGERGTYLHPAAYAGRN